VNRPTQAEIVQAGRTDVLKRYELYLTAIERGASAIEYAQLKTDWNFSICQWLQDVFELRKDRGWARVGPRPAAYVPPPIAGVRV